MKTRQLVESASFWIGSWNTRDELFDVWVVNDTSRHKEVWRWRTDDDRREIVRDLSRFRKRSAFFDELSRHAIRVKTPAKMAFDGPRCGDCGTTVTRGTYRCPSCDTIVDWDAVADYST